MATSSRRDPSGPEEKGTYPTLRGHGAAQTSHGLTRDARLNTTPKATTLSDRTLCTAPPAMQAQMGYFGPSGGAEENLLSATLFGICLSEQSMNVLIAEGLYGI